MNCLPQGSHGNIVGTETQQAKLQQADTSSGKWQAASGKRQAGSLAVACFCCVWTVRHALRMPEWLSVSGYWA